MAYGKYTLEERRKVRRIHDLKNNIQDIERRIKEKQKKVKKLKREVNRLIKQIPRYEGASYGKEDINN